MSIELEQVVAQDVSDDALRLAAGGAQGDMELECLRSRFGGVSHC